MSTETVLIFISGTILMLFLVVFIFIFALLFKKRQFVYIQEKNALKAQYEQEILTAQLEVQNTTLQHISQELHDNIGQLLAVARINLNVVEDSDAGVDNLPYIQQANELIAQSINDIRALTKSLDGDFVQDFGLSESVAQELQRIRSSGVFGTEFRTSGAVYSLGFQREIVLFRIVQEVINNAIKHARATKLTVTITYTPESVRLVLQDDGKGFDYQPVQKTTISQSGAGLRNMQRRATLIGGQCTITSSPGQGTTISITLLNQPA